MDHDFRRARGGGGSTVGPAQVSAGKSTLTGNLHGVAEDGVASMGGLLPYLDNIQASFGHHDVGEVRAHVGGPAADAAGAMGARAFAFGDDVGFAEAPDLHLAAHEAAHVVQQRGGVRLAGGVGQRGDQYEVHADLVADHVVRGESAEALLDTMAHRGADGGPAVQRDEPTADAGLDAGTRKYLAVLALVHIDRATWDSGYRSNVNFLGVRVAGGAHANLVAHLATAEATLVGLYPGRTPRQIAQQLGIDTIEGRRPIGDAAGRDVISAHSFGLAIDINKFRENRFVAMRANRRGAAGEDSREEARIIGRAMMLVHGQAYDITTVERHAPDEPEPTNEALHGGYTAASAAMITYFALEGNRAEVVRLLTAHGHLQNLDAAAAAQAIEETLRQIPIDHARMVEQNGTGHIDTGGFYDLELPVIEAMTGAGLRWGGRFAGGKDLMHFDLDDRSSINAARREAGSRGIH